jgi:hypothetical protein
MPAHLFAARSLNASAFQLLPDASEQHPRQQQTCSSRKKLHLQQQAYTFPISHSQASIESHSSNKHAASTSGTSLRVSKERDACNSRQQVAAGEENQLHMQGALIASGNRGRA